MRDTGRKLLEWYYLNKRELPWRKINEPYLIWISEIILQQTRVDQGMDYYLRFIDRFPDVELLAKADEEEVLKYWQGLGYYSRARNLHFSAKYICDEWGGKFPGTYDEILKLKGVGPYTAAAIASIAFNLSYPAVDGNVMRIISRIFGIDEPINSTSGEKEIKKAIDEIFLPDRPGDFNQAMMEFGALFCVPKNPPCEECFLKDACRAYNQNRVELLPVKIKAASPKDFFINYFVITDDENNIVFRKRSNTGIWKNLYDFPSIDETEKITTEQLIVSEEFKNLLNEQDFTISGPVLLKHQLSHKNIKAAFYKIEVQNVGKLKLDPGSVSIKITETETYPVSKLMASYIENHLFEGITE